LAGAFPHRNTRSNAVSAEIIDFRTAHRAPVATATEARTRPQGESTTTAKNLRLRQERFEVWRRIDASVNYWHARLKFEDAILRAARLGLREADSHRDVTDQTRWATLENYRAALCKQLLTPAPDVSSVNWKRTHLKTPCLDLKKDRIEKAIADDLAFLTAHPTRRPRKVEQA
jgi:hypothetical protein